MGQQAGDDIQASDFDAFFARHERPLYAYLRRLLPSEEVAVEIAQEAFFRAWTHFAELQRYDRPQAWLYRIATNLAISAHRRRQPTPLSQLLGRQCPDDEEGDELQESDSVLLADDMDVEECVAERDAIARVLLHLGERERAVLLLRAVQGFSHEQIGDALGVTTAHARQMAARARRRFCQLYAAETDGEAVS